jgi:threonine-phosphate decarboxylase
VLHADNGFSLSLQEFIHRLTLSNAQLCYIANPNNPTATQFTRAELIKLIKIFPDKLFVVDETYLPFTSKWLQDSVFTYAFDKLNLIVVTSMSKIFAVPGLRIGYCCSHPDNIKKIYGWILPYGVATLSLYLMPHLLDQLEFISHTQRQYHKNRQYFGNQLMATFNDKLKIYDSDTAFILVKFKDKLVDTTIISYLLEKGIKIRSGTEFSELDINWIRLSIKHINEIDYFIKNLSNILPF